MPLTDVNAFNPQCDYILEGWKVAHVDSTRIIANQIIWEGTSTTVTVMYYGKSTEHWVQRGAPNNVVDYGWSPTVSILYSCP